MNPGRGHGAEKSVFCHEWVGVIAAAEVTGSPRPEGDDEEYRDVRFLRVLKSR